jgi:hypothetical protein
MLEEYCPGFSGLLFDHFDPTWLDLAVRSFIPPWFYRNVHQICSRFHFLHPRLTLQLDAE